MNPHFLPEIVERLRGEGLELPTALRLAPLVAELAMVEARRLLSAAAGAPLPVSANPLTKLSPMEKRAVVAVASGGSQKETADALGISMNTLGTHLRRAYSKLGVHSRQEAADALRGVT